MRHPFRIIAIFMLMAVAACAATGERDERDGPREAREQTEAPRQPTQTNRAQSQTFYRVTRPDLRKCMYPMCGGVFVAEVNHGQSKCADNQMAADCYVSDIELSSLNLDPQLEAEVANLADGGQVLLRGELVAETTQQGTFGKLVVDAAWRGATLSAPTDPTYLVIDSGIVCITFPCFSLKQITLNSSVTGDVSGVDLAASGASQDDLTKAQSLLQNPGLIVSGTHITVSGPAGQGEQLVASEIYFPVQQGGGTCGNSVCGSGEFCCNPSCGICAPFGGACTEQACHPCGHSECDAGASLESSCSSCATKVCNADPFCCNNAWDSLCVQQAGQLCNNTCAPPPPPACTHDECKEGQALELGCSSCATDVCNQDAFCCDNAWDALCVTQATQLCNTCAPPPPPPPPSCAHSECSEGAVLEANCSSCATTVCGSDAFCCDSAWDGLCVDEAAAWCGNTCS